MMKKNSIKYRAYLLKRSEDEIKKRVLKNNLRRKDNSLKRGFYVLISPCNFTLASSGSRDRLLSFIKALHKMVANGKRKIWLDFSNTEKVVADGMIYLFAEISRMKKLFPKLVIKSTPPKDKIVGQVFKKIGFSNLIDCYIPNRSESNRKDVSNWLSASGVNVYARECGNILSHYKGRIAPSLSRELFKGMSEAMTNANHHAYIGKRDDPFSYVENFKPWWLFSQEVDGYLTVVFCDLGIGIPETLPKNKPSLMKRLVATFGNDLNDAITIKEAVVDSVTRTHKSHRGKGLRQVVETVDECESGQMYIFSNYGCYHYKSGGKDSIYDFANSIKGTIISWKVSMPEEAKIENAKYGAVSGFSGLDETTLSRA